MQIKHLTDTEIQNYLDSNLSKEKKALVVRHLQVCKKCQAEVRQYEAIYKGLNKEVTAKLPVNFSSAIITKIQDESSNLFKFKPRDIILSILGLIMAFGITAYFMGYKLLLQSFTNSFSFNSSIDFSIIKNLFAKFNLDFNLIILAGLILLLLLLLDNFISRHRSKLISLFRVLPTICF